MNKQTHAMPTSEWADLPITFGTAEVARVFGCTLHYAQTHARELGGVKVAKRWRFSKPKVAAMLGITDA